MERFKSRKLKEWKQTLADLEGLTGVSLEDVCRYADFTYNGKDTAIAKKLPKKRSSFIGVGMAYNQPLDVINGWIVHFAGKRRLYAKDISEDLIWIYLIEANSKDTESDKNYYRLYDKCQAVAYATWKELWDEITMDPEETTNVEIELENVDYDDEFKGLKTFVMNHMDSFKAAYSKPRTYLDSYVSLILDAFNAGSDMKPQGLTYLRGWIDDSMINYLSGDSEMINVIDRSSRKKTVRIKQVPKNRRIHISMCLALGMGVSEIDRYLEMMGFAPLDEENEDEKILIDILNDWKKEHPLAGKLKQELEGKESGLKDAERKQAAEEMVLLRQEINETYEEGGYRFPYMKVRKEEH